MSADRVRTAGGARAFVKAVSRSHDAVAHDLLRRELDVLGRLPDAAPAPRLLGAHDSDEWVALVIEDVDGRRPTLPSERRELIAVLGALFEQPVVRAHGASPVPDAAPELARLLGEGQGEGDQELRMLEKVAETASAELRNLTLAAGVGKDLF